MKRIARTGSSRAGVKTFAWGVFVIPVRMAWRYTNAGRRAIAEMAGQRPARALSPGP
ncbi:hypothetical protein RXV90_16865 [Rhodophyticola sp. MJ-SS7]|nr:hypothetical protein [Rhodophyticola sp. MJ-SS7]